MYMKAIDVKFYKRKFHAVTVASCYVSVLIHMKIIVHFLRYNPVVVKCYSDFDCEDSEIFSFETTIHFIYYWSF